MAKPYEPRKLTPQELAELHALPDDAVVTSVEAAAFLRLTPRTLAWTLASVREIKDNSKAELDKIMKEAGAPHAQLVAQRQFYDSPAKVLARAALGDPKRTEYLQQLQHAGPAELGHMAQVAVGTRNVALASAVLSLIDRLPTKDRPVGPVELASAMKQDDFLKVQEYIKLGDARLQGILVAIRAWNSGKSNPLSSVQLAMREQEIDHDLIGGDGDD